MTSPSVTVVMPVRNEEGFIERSLGSVLAQDYPADLTEILVVDGRSDDSTREIVERMGEQAHRAVRVVDNPKRIQAAALNIGVAHAKGEILVRVDGHCEIAPDYVRRCVEVLQSSGADNAGGLMTARGEGRIGRAIALATSTPFGIGNSRFHYAAEPDWTDTVYLGAFRRSVFDRVGTFAEDVGPNEDDDLNRRILESGGRIRLDPSIKSVYYCRPSLGAAWRQYYRYGLFRPRVLGRRGIGALRQLVPAALVAGLAASFVTAIVTRRYVWALIVAGPYALASLVATLVFGRRDRSTMATLPAVYATLHIAYGTGFWRGLFGLVTDPRTR